MENEYGTMVVDEFNKMNRNHRVYPKPDDLEREYMNQCINAFVDEYDKVESEGTFTIAFYPDRSTYDKLDNTIYTLISRFKDLCKVTIICHDFTGQELFIESKKYCEEHDIGFYRTYCNINNNTKDTAKCILFCQKKDTRIKIRFY